MIHKSEDGPLITAFGNEKYGLTSLQLLLDIELSALQCSLSPGFQPGTECQSSVMINPQHHEGLEQVTPFTGSHSHLPCIGLIGLLPPVGQFLLIW